MVHLPEEVIEGENKTMRTIFCLALFPLLWTIAPARTEPRASDARKPAARIPADQFDKLRALIKPLSGGFDDIPWMTDLCEAREKAAAEGKPLLVWVGDGHPLGWT